MCCIVAGRLIACRRVSCWLCISNSTTTLRSQARADSFSLLHDHATSVVWWHGENIIGILWRFRMARGSE